MSRVTRLVRGSAALAALALAGAVTACQPDVGIVMPKPADPLFASYVSIGNSIAAGVQSGGINDSTQRQSYAYKLAQAMGTRFAVPFIPFPGCTPPTANWQTGALVGGTASTCTLRDAKYATTVLNNVAVPSAASTEVNAPVSPFHNVLTNLFLGGRTQVQRAIEADPTFVTIEIGPNDVLQAAYTGVITPMAGVSRGITPFATFKANYDQMLADLKAGAPRLQGGVLLSNVNASAAPLIFPAAAFSNPAFLAGFSIAATGSPTGVTVLPNCVGSTSLVSFAILPQIKTYKASNGTAGHPPVISCEKGQFPPSALVGELFILDAAEQATMTAAVSQMNTYIKQQADAMNFAYLDMNTLLVSMRTPTGCSAIVPNLAAAPTTSPFGSCFSFDGLHPSSAGQTLLANALIDVINAKYGTSLQHVQ